MASAELDYMTKGGIGISRKSHADDYDTAISKMLERIDTRRGAVFSSNYEYPGRYTRWDTAIVDPPLGIEANGRKVCVIAYNERGKLLLPVIANALRSHDHVGSLDWSEARLEVQIAARGKVMSEEQRSRVPTAFSAVREIVDLFRSDEDPNFGLYGAFGYDLAFQFDDIEEVMQRPEDQRDLVLYLPDEILVVDHHQAIAWHDRYEFTLDGKTTEGLPRETDDQPFIAADTDPPRGDHNPGEYAKLVEKAKEKKEKTFDKVWRSIKDELLAVDYFFAHNAPFDRSVLHSSCYYYNLDIPQQEFKDTVKIARNFWDFENNKLNTVCKNLRIPLNHHDALSDAKGCAMIAIEAFKKGYVI